MSSRDADSQFPTAPPEFVRLAPPVGPDLRSTALGRRMVYFAAIIMGSLMSGVALVFVPPALVFGALFCLMFVWAVMKKPYVGLIVYLLTFILRPGEVYEVLAPLRLERLVGMLTLLSLILSQIQAHGRLLLDRSRQTRHMFLLVLAAFLSMPFAYWRLGAMNGVVEFIKILVLYVLVVHLIDTRERLRKFVYLYGALIGYIAIQALSSYIRGSLLVAQGIDRAVGDSSAGGGPNELGATMATTIPLFLLLGMKKSLGWKRLIFLFVLVVMVCTLTITGSRSGFLGFLAGMGYLWWISKKKVLFGILGLIVLAGGLSVMPEQYKGRYATVTQSELDGSSKARLDVWTKGLGMFVRRPLTGVGIHCFAAANATDFSTGSRTRRSWLESHSLYVQIPAETGLIGTFAFFSFLIIFLRLNRRTMRQLLADEDDWTLEATFLQAFFIGTLVLLVTGVFGHSLMRRTWYLYAALGLSTLRIYLQNARNLTPKLRSELMR